MKKIICVVMFVLFVLVGKGQNLNGSWTLEKIQMEEVQEGRVATYTSLSPIDEFIGKEKFPEQLIIEDGEATYIYANGELQKVRYSTEQNTIIVNMMVSLESYSYQTETNGTLILKATYQRLDNTTVVSYAVSGYYKK